MQIRSARRLAVALLWCAAPAVGCGVLSKSPAVSLLPWKEQPKHFNWLITVGPAVNFWSDPPPGVADVFFGLRVGLFLATHGEHHISVAQAEDSWFAEVGRHTYFRSGLPVIPDNFFLSPLGDATGMSVYGIGFRPASFGMHPAGGLFRFGFSGGVVVTYAHIETFGQSATVTDFLRPGFDIRADVELDWGGDFFLALGWSSLFHAPQSFGAAIDSDVSSGPQLWHLGQIYLLFYIRLPNKATD